MMAAWVTSAKTGRPLPGGVHPHYDEAAHTLAHSAGIQTVRLPAAIDGDSER